MSYFSEMTLNQHQVSLDAGGRVRTSGITTLGDYKILGFDKTLLIHTTGSGQGTYSDNTYHMDVTGSGQYLIRQSKKFHGYFSGKSQLIECTFDEFQPEPNVEKRVGYFSSNAVAPYSSSYDGFWLQSSGSKISLEMQHEGVSTLSVPLSQWIGAAELATFDWSKFVVVLFDFLWLGGAVLRLWVWNYEGWILAHEFTFSGFGDGTFIQSSNQPLRYELRSCAAGASGSLHYICAQVATEGGIDEAGISREVNSGYPGITFTTQGTKYPLLAIKKQTAYRDIPIELTGIGTITTTNNDVIRWTLESNPTVSSALAYKNLESSSIQYAIGDGTITVTQSGSVVAGGMVSQGGSIQADVLKRNYLSVLGSKIDDTMDELVLCVTPLTASPLVFGSLTFKEY